MSASSQPLVSVVVPVYNEAEYLGECLESILAQTYSNWNCVVVDNCSTDGSGEIAARYAAKDPRIRVHSNREFLRAVPNYNVAWRQISLECKYAKMVFSDDWIFPECLERMVAVAEEHPTVGIVGAYGLQGKQVMWIGLPYPSKLVPGREICRKLFLDGLYIFGTATSLLFRAQSVRGRNPFYDQSNLHSDSEACLALLKTCDFGFVNQVLTYTRARPSSLTALSAEMNTWIAGRLLDVVMHGLDCLTQEEFAFCLDQKLNEYYRFLARNLVRRRGKDFWVYHKRKFTETGLGWSRARLAKAAMSEILGAVLNPKDTLDWLLKRRNLRRGAEFLKRFQENAPTR